MKFFIKKNAKGLEMCGVNWGVGGSFFCFWCFWFLEFSFCVLRDRDLDI